MRADSDATARVQRLGNGNTEHGYIYAKSGAGSLTVKAGEAPSSWQLVPGLGIKHLSKTMPPTHDEPAIFSQVCTST